VLLGGPIGLEVDCEDAEEFVKDSMKGAHHM